MKQKLLFILIVFHSSIFIYAAPNVDKLINEVILGNTIEANKKLPTLLDDYPNNGDILFLQGILEVDGKSSIEIYKKIYKFHKNNKYADDAVMRIGEYYYVSGLYIQAAEWFKKMHMYYRRSEHIENGINLFLKCLIIAGSVDTALSYSETYSNILPKIKINNKIKETFSEFKNEIPTTKTSEVIEKIIIEKEKSNYSIQIGAYSNRDNAEKAMYNLRSVGYTSRIQELNKKNKILYTVRCGYYDTKKSANKIKKRLRIHLGYDPIVVQN